jgi:hypothetical protein
MSTQFKGSLGHTWEDKAKKSQTPSKKGASEDGGRPTFTANGYTLDFVCCLSKLVSFILRSEYVTNHPVIYSIIQKQKSKIR